MNGPFLHRFSVCRRTLILAAAICAMALSASSQSSTAPRRGGNPEAAKLKNPVPYGPESVAAGKRTYARLCASCHGPKGKGDGGGSGAGGQASDLTDSTWDYGSSDGEIFSVIRDGVSADMQGYADQISDKDIWNLVNFIRSIGPDKEQQ
jgi:mono/diheme cytochrome c family protein